MMNLDDIAEASWPSVIPGAIYAGSKINKRLVQDSTRIELLDGRLYEAMRAIVPVVTGYFVGSDAGSTAGIAAALLAYCAMSVVGGRILMNERRELENPLNRALMNSHTIH